jgi:putative transposase
MIKNLAWPLLLSSLGNAAFAAQVSTALGRRAVPGKSGRPRRVGEPESRELWGD